MSFEKTGRWNDQNGNPKYFLAIVRATSERKRAEEALEKYRREIEQQNMQLKKVDQLETDFLNVTSHELHTPMSLIKGYTQIISKQTLGQINDEQKKALEIILRNSNQVDTPIQDILDISRLESGTIKFIPEKTNMKSILEQTVKPIQSFADTKNIKITINLEENLPDLIID